MKRWRLTDAKTRFGELLTHALEDGPQLVTRYGKDTVVVMSAEEYRRMAERKPTLKEFLLNGPKIDVDFSADRSKSRSRNFTFDDE